MTAEEQSAAGAAIAAKAVEDAAATTAAKAAESTAPPTWDTWHAEQPEPVRALIEGHTKGLKTALESERGARGRLETQVRDLAAKAEKGSDLEKQLTDMATSLAETSTKNDFYEAAHAAGVTNLKLAWIVAKQDELFDRKGNADFTGLKAAYPQLFEKAPVPPPPPANAGAGTQGAGPKKGSMNEWIRERAGVAG